MTAAHGRGGGGCAPRSRCCLGTWRARVRPSPAWPQRSGNGACARTASESVRRGSASTAIVAASASIATPNVSRGTRPRTGQCVHLSHASRASKRWARISWRCSGCCCTRWPSSTHRLSSSTLRPLLVPMLPRPLLVPMLLRPLLVPMLPRPRVPSPASKRCSIIRRPLTASRKHVIGQRPRRRFVVCLSRCLGTRGDASPQ